MIQTILVPLDGSELAEQVLPYAVSFAQGLDARIWLLHVIDPESLPPLAEEHQVYLDQLQQNAEAHARTYLEHQASQLRQLGVASVMTSVQYGKPADVLAGYGEGVMAHDLIALSTHGRSGLSRLLLGSVADRVLHSTNTPLLMVRPREGQAQGTADLKTIVVPLDGSDIAESVLPVVAELARLKLDVHLVWAVLLGAGLYTGPQPGGYPPDIVQVLKKNAETYLNQVSERRARDGLRVHTHVPLHYSASGAIVEYAHDQENAFIAMSTHGRSGVGRWALGSVTNAVVRSGDLPVLIVRPS